MPHVGTARADFPGCSADHLFEFIQKIYSLPENTKVYVGHDYPRPEDDPEAYTTLKTQIKNNIMINNQVSKEKYIELRQARDKTLAVPKLLLPSLQVNLMAGELLKPEDNGISYIKIPINQL